MSFKTYDILSSLIPGFILLMVGIFFMEIEYDPSYSLPYFVLAFIIGYANNSIGSWLERFYFWTWGGKPSNKLLEGKDIKKVRFFDAEVARELLILETNNPTASNDELFAKAQMLANNTKSNRLSDFHLVFVFSRSMLTAIMLGGLGLLPKMYDDLWYYPVFLTAIFIFWYRGKQQSYYYAREVLIEYLQSRRND